MSSVTFKGQLSDPDQGMVYKRFFCISDSFGPMPRSILKNHIVKVLDIYGVIVS